MTRNLVFCGLFVGGLPGILLVGAVAERLGLHNPGGLIAFGWMVAFAGVGIWRTSWNCPRCRKRFYYKWWYGNAFALKCVHCGFRPTRG